MTHRFVSMYWGAETATRVANGLEYAPHTDPHWDPFAVIHGLVPQCGRSLMDCVGPAKVPEES